MYDIDQTQIKKIKHIYDTSEQRIIFLDYDGTLVPFADRPENALPSCNLLQLLNKLSRDRRNTIVIISGRDRQFLDTVFYNMRLTLVAEHGFFTKKSGGEWETKLKINEEWKKAVRMLMSRYMEIFPCSIVEEKSSAMAWHYRNCSTAPTEIQLVAFKALITQFTKNYPVELLTGKDVIEVKNQIANKGEAARNLIMWTNPGFILAAGDDKTDEDLFTSMPGNAFTIKVGSGKTSAKNFYPTQDSLAALLQYLSGHPFTTT